MFTAKFSALVLDSKGPVRVFAIDHFLEPSGSLAPKSDRDNQRFFDSPRHLCVAAIACCRPRTECVPWKWLVDLKGSRTLRQSRRMLVVGIFSLHVRISG